MKKVLVAALLVTAGFPSAFVLHGAVKSGEALFLEYCSACHAKGGNIINPQKTLFRIDREANGVRRPQDIVSKMRNPGPGMSRYDKGMIPDEEALKIGAYIINNFR